MKMKTLLILMALIIPGCDLTSRVVGTSDAPDGGLVTDGPALPPDSTVTPDLLLPPDGWPPASAPCMAESKGSPNGVRTLTYHKSKENRWHLALDPVASHSQLVAQGGLAGTEAAAMDHKAAGDRVAGFVLVQPVTGNPSVQDSLTQLITRIQQGFPNKTRAEVRTSGTQITSHEHFPQAVGTILDLDLATTTTPSAVRDALLPSLLVPGNMAALKNSPPHWGSADKQFVISLATVRRYQRARDPKTGALKLDGEGYVKEGTDTSHRALLVVGAVALRDDYQDLTRRTGLLVNDLAGGTAAALGSTQLAKIQCDTFAGTDPAKADIIWVVDESGSMRNNREDIVHNAADFFDRAVASGLDFRVAVTNVCNPQGSYKTAVGKFCSTISQDPNNMGGDDRFLLPRERDIFAACVRNPPGYEGSQEYGIINARRAVQDHLPRKAGAPGKIRPGATLVVIVATDEIAGNLTSILYSSKSACTLTDATKSKMAFALLPQHAFFSGNTDPEARTAFHVIGGVCANSCKAHVAHGYSLLARALGGQVADVCQKDLGPTMQSIIDTVAGKGSTTRLSHVPVAASLAVAKDGVAIKRSRNKGFDYRPTANSIVFIDVPFKKGSKALVGYRRWN